MHFSCYPPGNQHIPPKWHFEDDFPFPKVGYVNCLEGSFFLKNLIWCASGFEFEVCAVIFCLMSCFLLFLVLRLEFTFDMLFFVCLGLLAQHPFLSWWKCLAFNLKRGTLKKWKFAADHNGLESEPIKVFFKSHRSGIMEHVVEGAFSNAAVIDHGSIISNMYPDAPYLPTFTINLSPSMFMSRKMCWRWNNKHPLASEPTAPGIFVHVLWWPLFFS